MNVILLFFALPIATIILAIAVEKILKRPSLTAATFFAIFLIVAFAVFDASFLVFVIAYTLIAYITAIIAEIFFNRCRRRENKCCCLREENSGTNLSNEEIQRISRQVANILSNTNNNGYCCSNDIATVNVRNTNGEQTTWCCRRR